ncbi:unnamed protein product [Clonostachys byssicola]|uniref:Uncharacterized protein n=1 Tax=Clonostachys byssicola TaxID=160290 RepID=A0A9N9UIB0_9HYPO|nr:unnamed protein product [Clonostachys byssicola]
MRAFLLLLSASLSAALEINALIGVSPVSPLFESELLPRANIDLKCVASVVEKIFPTEIPNTRFASWVLTASPEMPACTVTVPASFSSEYLSYDKVISTVASTITSAVQNVKYTCGDPFTISFTDHYCASSRTVLFTSRNQTDTTVLPVMTDTGPIVLGAAQHDAVPRALSVLAIGTVIVALAL